MGYIDKHPGLFAAEALTYCAICYKSIDRTDAPWRTTYCGLYCAAIAVTDHRKED